jgi:hypothetical protein
MTLHVFFLAIHCNYFIQVCLISVEEKMHDKGPPISRYFLRLHSIPISPIHHLVPIATNNHYYRDPLYRRSG